MHFCNAVLDEIDVGIDITQGVERCNAGDLTVVYVIRIDHSRPGWGHWRVAGDLLQL